MLEPNRLKSYSMLKAINYHLFAISLIAISCKKKENTEVYPAPTNPNLEYYGYALVDVGFDDPSDKEIKTNYLDEVASFTNLADILVVEPTDDIRDRIIAMNNSGVKAMLHLSELFFENVGTVAENSTADYSLRADYQSRWDQFVVTNEMNIYDSLVQVFYIGEEPYWNNISVEELTLACDYIKSTVPSVKIMVIEAYHALDQLVIPASVDWVGFDHYFIKDPQNDVTFLEEMALLESKMYSNQQIVLVMDAHFIKLAHATSGIGKSDLDFIARSYYQLANSNHRVAAIIAYFWPSGFDSEDAIGSRNLPVNVKNEHVRIGKAITGK